MKITNVDLYSNEQVVANFSYRDPMAKMPYQIQSMTGLDADNIIPKFYGKSADSTKKYYELSMANRQIVVLVLLNPQYGVNKKSYSDLRDDMYSAIYSSRTGLIQLRFNNGTTTMAAISGFVSKFESNLTSRTPQLQITINCDDATLRAVERFDQEVAELQTSMTVVDDLSTMPHGFRFSLVFDADTTSFVIKDAITPEWSMTITPGTIGADTGFKTFDELHFSSEPDTKDLYIVRGVTKVYLTDKVQLGSIWPILFPKQNNFEVVTGAFHWLTMDWYPTYWGV